MRNSSTVSAVCALDKHVIVQLDARGEHWTVMNVLAPHVPRRGCATPSHFMINNYTNMLHKYVSNVTVLGANAQLAKFGGLMCLAGGGGGS